MTPISKEKKVLRQSPDKFYKSEVLRIKKDLPKNIRDLIYENFPEYNTAKGHDLIMNVLAGRSPDMKLTEILKQFALANIKPTQTEIPA